MTLSLEEASDLQEMLIAACERSLASGRDIAPCSEEAMLDGYNCPLGALLSRVYPLEDYAESRGIPKSVALGVIRGFDGESRKGDRLAYEVGRALRRRFCPEAA